MSASRNLEKVISKVGDLPAIPEIVDEVMRITDDPNVSLSEVSAVIERDPALAAKLLRVSNSPYYGMKQVVGTLKLALVILGVREVRNIVFGISVLDSLKDRFTNVFIEKGGFLRHSVQVGGIAKKLGTHFSLSLQGEDFISGLLHDIGKLVLWKCLPDEYKPIYETSGGASETLCGAEVEVFGFDHADVAATLATNWNLPESLVDALWYHHRKRTGDLEEAKDPKLAALVRIANLATHEDLSVEDPSVLRSCSDEDGWELLLDSDETLPYELRRDLLAGFQGELENKPMLSF